MQETIIILTLVFLVILALIFLFDKIQDVIYEKFPYEANGTEATLINDVLINKFEYFKHLTLPKQRIFVNRVAHFINHKQFYGKQGLVVTFEMKVLVSACAIQLTFGFKRYILKLYKNIVIYPTDFYSRLFKTYFRGATTDRGTISLSWKHFEEGYAIPTDALNLGLHEFAHAIKLDVTKGEEFDDDFAAYLDDFNNEVNGEFEKLKAATNTETFLRKYGATNIDEFFSVCVEYFFEVPAELKKRLPHIYHHVSSLLNQDPLNKTDNYQLYNYNTRDKKLTMLQLLKIVPRHKYHSFHWSYSLILLGLFLAWVFILVPISCTYIDGDTYRNLFVFFVVVSLLQAYQLVYKLEILDIKFFVFYTACGVYLNGLALFLLLNYTLSFSSFEERYNVKSRSSYYSNTIVGLENDAFSNDSEIRTPDRVELNSNSTKFIYVLKYRRGFFAGKVLVDKVLTN